MSAQAVAVHADILAGKDATTGFELFVCETGRRTWLQRIYRTAFDNIPVFDEISACRIVSGGDVDASEQVDYFSGDVGSAVQIEDGEVGACQHLCIQLGCLVLT